MHNFFEWVGDAFRKTTLGRRLYLLFHDVEKDPFYGSEVSESDLNRI